MNLILVREPPPFIDTLARLDTPAIVKCERDRAPIIAGQTPAHLKRQRPTADDVDDSYRYGQRLRDFPTSSSLEEKSRSAPPRDPAVAAMSGDTWISAAATKRRVNRTVSASSSLWKSLQDKRHGQTQNVDHHMSNSSPPVHVASVGPFSARKTPFGFAAAKRPGIQLSPRPPKLSK